MPFRVVVTGRVTEEPSQLLEEDSWVVFVLDPFPGSAGARLAHACEVVCRSHSLATSAVESVRRGDRVVAIGQLVLERIDGPIEDDLSAVRVRIMAASAALRSDSDAP